jgi:hypothetical protein
MPRSTRAPKCAAHLDAPIENAPVDDDKPPPNLFTADGAINLDAIDPVT